MRVALSLLIAVVAAVNVIVTVRLWRSRVYVRGQKVAQTLLLWLVPGFVAVVHLVLRTPGESRLSDPTASNEAATDYSSFGSRTYGSSYPDGT